MDGAVGIVLEIVLVIGVDGQQLGAAVLKHRLDAVAEDLVANGVDQRAQGQFVVGEVFGA